MFGSFLFLSHSMQFMFLIFSANQSYHEISFFHRYLTNEAYRVQLYLATDTESLNVTGLVYPTITMLDMNLEPDPYKSWTFTLNDVILLKASVLSGDYVTFRWSTAASGIIVKERYVV